MPVSSSAHLILANDISNLGIGSIYLDTGMHLGSLLAVIFYFRNDLKKITKNKSIQSLKYSFIERLKRINCPEEIITEIIGIKKRTIFYKNEVSVEMKYSWLNQIIE